MFHLPRELQSKIFSFDPTYRNIWKSVMFQLHRCTYCRFDERVEFTCPVWGDPQGEIQKNFCHFEHCSLDCMGFSLRQEKKWFNSVWSFPTYELREHEHTDGEYETDEED